MKDKIKIIDNIGGLIISDDVISSIAVNAAKDVDGVTGFVTRTPDFVQTIFKKEDDNNKSVKVQNSDGGLKLDIGITVSNSAKIQTVASEVQNSIKNAVQNMTGKIVSKVNVNIAGVTFGDEK
ncbi:MAG: Asp23/Gls24 family envelope stress response protein [Clostridiales bacterium]|nr:Asp23/Gls24 family envelope stress response protein [Clostridiales bacterium]